MTRGLYQFILRMHPPAFRRRFGGEMMSIFEEAETQYSSALIFDGLVSFTRQWLLRTDSWKLPVAVCGGFIQVLGFGVPFKGHQYWTENHQALTPSMQEVILFALALVCSLFILITLMSLWNARFQRRRCVRHISNRSAFPTVHRLGVLPGRK